MAVGVLTSVNYLVFVPCIELLVMRASCFRSHQAVAKP